MRSKWSRHTWFRPLVLACCLVLAGSLPTTGTMAQEAGTPVPGGTLRIVAGQELDTLDPPNTVLGASYAVISMIYDRLVSIGIEDGLPKPWLAESWETSEDGLTITFHVREGVMFTDGTPLDAAAVKFNLDRWLESEVTGTVDLGTLESVEAPDETTVILHFSAPFAAIFSSLSALGIHSPTAYEADPENFGRNPVGSGPFMLVEWQAGTMLRLERNTDYVNYYADDENRGPAYLDAIELYIITEPATQTAAFENGELDALAISRQDFESLEANPEVKILTVNESTVISHLQYADVAPYNSLEFRQAVSYAINAEQIVELAYLGGATVNQCPLPLGVPGHNPALCAEHGYSYDPERAAQILADAGWSDSDGDGFIDIEGVEGPVVLYTYGPNPGESRTVELIQGDLQAVGIETEIRVLEIATLLTEIDTGEADFYYIGWGYPDPALLSQIFMSPGWAGDVITDPELDELLAAADAALDPEARFAALDAVMAYMLDHAITTPIVTPAIDYALQDNVNGFKLDVANVPHYTDVWLASD